MTWSWWHLSPLLIPLAMIVTIVMASGWRPSVKGISVPSLGGSWVRYILAGLGVLGVGLLVKHFYPEKFWLFIIMVVVTAVIVFWTQVWKMIMALIGLGVFFLLLGMGSCFTDCGVGLKGALDDRPATGGTRALIPRFDGFTPCDPTFDYPFELDTQGDPITMDIPGIGKVHYSGKGKLDLGEKKEKRTPGPVHIVSDDSRKQARVRIWEIVYVKE